MFSIQPAQLSLYFLLTANVTTTGLSSQVGHNTVTPTVHSEYSLTQHDLYLSLALLPYQPLYKAQ